MEGVDSAKDLVAEAVDELLLIYTDSLQLLEDLEHEAEGVDLNEDDSVVPVDDVPGKNALLKTPGPLLCLGCIAFACGFGAHAVAV